MTVTESQRYDIGHRMVMVMVMSQSHKSQHVTKKLVDRHKNCRRQGV